MNSLLPLAEMSPEEVGKMVGSGIVLLIGVGILILFIVSLVKACTRKSAGWIVTCVVTGLLSGVVLLGAIASFSAKAMLNHRKAMAAATLKQVSSEDGEISISVPSNWKPLTEAPEGAILSQGRALEEKYLTVMRASKKDFTGNLKSYQKLISETIEKRIKNGEFSLPEDKPIGDFPALRWDAKGEISQVQVVYHMAAVETEDSFYHIITWTLKSKDEANAPELEKVVKSFTAKAGPPSEAANDH